MGKIMQGLKPPLLMVFVQIAYAAVNIVYKLAINDGMSMTVASAYRLIFASAVTIPLALIFDRKKRPKITLRVLVLAFLCGMFGGSLFLNLYAVGLAMTSATFMLAVVNLIPGITFILATSFGLEKLNIRAPEGKAKVIGTIIGISGAMVITFLKGFEINILSSKMKEKTQVMPLQNTTISESQSIEVAVMSTPVNDHHCVECQCKQSQTSATTNVTNDDHSLSMGK